MSYDIELCDPVTKKVIELDQPHFIAGGTYQVGGTQRLWLNITYNYSTILYRVLGDNGIRGIYGKTGAEVIPILKDAISKLGDDIDKNYWTATEGNVKKALCGLLALAQLRPDGVFDGD